MRIFIVVILLCLNLLNAYPTEKVLASGNCGVDSTFPNFDTSVYHYQTAETVTAVTVNDVSPKVQTPENPSLYLSPTSCLGYAGPIGPYGPLASLGPLGTNMWSASYWISGTGMDWSTYSQEVSGMGNPLTADGPLGSNGPLNDVAYYQTLPCINDFSSHLSAGGLWTILGPLGPMGPAGALGPLGPIGAHGYTTDSNGQYMSGSQVMRSISVLWNSTETRTWDLYESYTQNFANQFTDNDCSFYVEGVYNSNGASGDTYNFTSHAAQYVTILLVPLQQLDTWQLTVKNTLGNIIAVSASSSFINWIQIRVPINTQLSVEVALTESLQYLSSNYRLYVAGATSYIAPATHIQGPHLISYTIV